MIDLPESHYNAKEEDYSSLERVTECNKLFLPSSYIAMKLRLSVDTNLNQEMMLCIKKVENAEMAFSFSKLHNAIC